MSKSSDIYNALTDEWQDIETIGKNAKVDNMVKVSQMVCLFVSFGTAEHQYPIHTKPQMYRRTLSKQAEPRTIPTPG